LKKIIILLLSAYFGLIGINLAAKFTEFFFIFMKMNLYMSFIYMFLFSFTLRLLIIIFYDYKKIDVFKIKWLKEHTNINSNEGNSFTKKIERLKKISEFFDQFILLKWFGVIFFFTGLCLTEPIIVVIFYRRNYYNWNYRNDYWVFLSFIFSCVLCTYTLQLTFITIRAIFF